MSVFSSTTSSSRMSECPERPRSGSPRAGETYRARIGELVDRHRVRVRVRPLGAVVCVLPVHRVTARFLRRSASRTVTLAWNPVDRALEPPACEGCGTGTAIVVLCDECVHLLCPGCHGDCETCGRPYCRACYSRCPRRHE